MIHRHHAVVLALAALLGPSAAIAGANAPAPQAASSSPGPKREAKPSPSEPFERILVRDWSRDGRYLVYTAHHGTGHDAYSETLFTGVISVRDGAETRFDQFHYYRWFEAHHDQMAGWDLVAPPGQAVPEAVVEGDGEWVGKDGKEWQFHGKRGTRVRCAIEVGGKRLASHSFEIPPGTGETTIEAYWSPEYRRIAWLFTGYRETAKSLEPMPERRLFGAELIAAMKERTPRFFSELVIDRGVGPRIEITGPEALGPAAFEDAADRIEKLGFAPTGRSYGVAPAKPVVYAVAQWKKEAAAIAAALPGGAEVRPLASPRKGFEVVVALAGAPGAKGAAAGAGPAKK